MRETQGFRRKLLAVAVAGVVTSGLRHGVAADLPAAGVSSDDSGTMTLAQVAGEGVTPGAEPGPSLPIQTETRLPTQEPPQLPPTSQGAATEPSLSLPEGTPDILSAVRWNLGPTRLTWSGLASVDYFYLHTDPGNNTNNFNGTLTLTGSANTFVWQPWFMQLNGLLGMSVFYNQSTSDQPVVGPVNISNEKQTTLAPFGNVQVQVFPYSRFPFQAYLDKTNSNTHGQIFDQTYDTLRYGLRQRYTTPRGDQTYGFTYDHSLLDSEFSGLPSTRDNLDVATMTGSYGIQNQTIAGYLEWDRDRQNNGFSANNYNALLQHFWAVSPQADLSSDASYRKFKSANNNPFQTPLPILGFIPPPPPEDRTFIQLNSYGTWRAETLPLTGFATLRYFSNDVSVANSPSAVQDTVDGSVSATYNLNRNATVSGRLGATAIDGDISTNEAVLGNYFADAIPLGAWQYFWNVSGSLANVTGGADNGTVLGAGFGQNAYRPVGEWGGGPATLSLFQTLAQTVGNGTFQDVTTLGLGGSLNWNRQFGGATANAGLSASDTRAWGDQEYAFDLANFQVGLEGQFTRNSGWSGSLTAQWSRQEQQKPQRLPTVTDLYVNANISYRNFRLFNVPRLLFTSTLQTYDFQSKREEGNLESAPRNTQWRWENRLFYPIGKTEVEGRLQLNRIEVGSNQTNEWLVGVRILRRLGN